MASRGTCRIAAGPDERGSPVLSAYVGAQDNLFAAHREAAAVLDLGGRRAPGTAAGSSLVRPLTAAQALDGWAVVEQLRVDISPHVRVRLMQHPIRLPANLNAADRAGPPSQP